MNTNEAVGYLLQYMPLQLRNACTVATDLSLIFGDAPDARQIVIPGDRPITKEALNELIRKARK
jgi:hypothetical protein